MSVLTQGKTWVRLVAALILSGTVLSILSFVATFGTSTLVPQIVRFALTLLICAYLVQGRQWARWLTVFLCGVATVTAFSTSGSATADVDAGSVTLLRVLGLIYLGCIVVLLVPAPVRAYFARAGDGDSGEG